MTPSDVRALLASGEYARILERPFMTCVVEEAEKQGWHAYAVLDTRHYARRTAKGWPDVILVRGDSRGAVRCIAAELKRERGRLTAEQREWLELLGGVGGIDTYIWRPSQWQEILEVLESN